MNSNSIPAYMEIGDPKLYRTLKNQMISRIFPDKKAPGSSTGTRVPAVPSLAPPGFAAGFLVESQVNSSLPCQTSFEQHRERPGCLKS